jgi:hypothetical protein
MHAALTFSVWPFKSHIFVVDRALFYVNTHCGQSTVQCQYPLWTEQCSITIPTVDRVLFNVNTHRGQSAVQCQYPLWAEHCSMLIPTVDRALFSVNTHGGQSTLHCQYPLWNNVFLFRCKGCNFNETALTCLSIKC